MWDFNPLCVRFGIKACHSGDARVQGGDIGLATRPHHWRSFAMEAEL
jgi:hypothetical protein